MTESFDQLIKVLLTDQELATLKKRFRIAQLLETDLTYRQIARQLKVSTTTVVRVNKQLQLRQKRGRAGKGEKTKKIPWVIG